MSCDHRRRRRVRISVAVRARVALNRSQTETQREFVEDARRRLASLPVKFTTNGNSLGNWGEVSTEDLDHETRFERFSPFPICTVSMLAVGNRLLHEMKESARIQMVSLFLDLTHITDQPTKRTPHCRRQPSRFAVSLIERRSHLQHRVSNPQISMSRPYSTRSTVAKYGNTTSVQSSGLILTPC